MKKKVNLTKLITIEMLDILPIRSFKAFERCLFQGMKLILGNLQGNLKIYHRILASFKTQPYIWLVLATVKTRKRMTTTKESRKKGNTRGKNRAFIYKLFVFCFVDFRSRCLWLSSLSASRSLILQIAAFLSNDYRNRMRQRRRTADDVCLEKFIE